jgi:hypothetical protein
MRAKNFDLHDKLFLKSKAVTLFSVLIWFLAASVASIPISGWVPVSYNFYQAACVPVFSGNISYLCIANHHQIIIYLLEPLLSPF